MTELQKCELSILENVISVCDELGLTYYLVCGSALGAIKYNGFIPWDDDVDIAMHRDEYCIFCEKAPKMLKSNLFLQNNDTEPLYPLIFSKVRDSNTTFIEKSLSKLNIHHGVYIDVFPLDNYPKKLKAQRKIERAKKWYLRFYRCCMDLELSKMGNILARIQKLLQIDKHPRLFIKMLEKQIIGHKDFSKVIWCNHGNWQGVLEYAPKSQYGEGVMAVFEGLQVRVPECFDEYLTQKYGDWRSELPEEEKKGHHFAEKIDLCRPYTDYVEKMSNGHIKIKKIIEK